MSTTLCIKSQTEIFPIDPNRTFDFSLLNSTTIPCSVSDNCNQDINYVPVWRKNSSNVTVECPSPLFIRKDVFTCNKINKPITSELNTTNLTYDPNCKNCNIGFVGINTTAPEEQLHVLGSIKAENGNIIGSINTNTITNNTLNKFDANGNPYPILPIVINSGETNISGNLNVANQITTTNLVSTNVTTSNIFVNSDLKIKDMNGNNIFALYQNGKLRTREIRIDLLPIPDYVFQKEYKLMPLEELEVYISKEKHLPNIKSEKEYKEIGEINIGELNAKLLEKVEELTLYVISLKNEINKLKK